MTTGPLTPSSPDIQGLPSQDARSSLALPVTAPPSVSQTVRRDSMAFAASDTTTRDVEHFVRAAASTWRLTKMSDDLVKMATELVNWARAHGSATVLRVTLTWDDPLVHLEVFDRGAINPDPFVSLADAELGARLLTPPGVEWGADLDSRGRCLWVSLRTRQDVAFLRGSEISA